MDKQKVQRLVTTSRSLDKMKDPPEYVDDIIPNKTIKFRGPMRRASARAPLGTIPGSYYITGSHYDASPGTYSLMITRVSLGVTGTTAFKGTMYSWYIRHSREGTVDKIDFATPGREFRQGDMKKPIYSFGPGTVIYGFTGDHLGNGGTHVTFTQTMEGIVG